MYDRFQVVKNTTGLFRYFHKADDHFYANGRRPLKTS